MTNKRVYWNPVYRNNPLLRMFTSVPSLSPPPHPFFPGVQFNSLPTERRALLFERLERATGGQNHCLGLGGVKSEVRVSRPRAEGIEHTVKIFSFLRELETRPMTLKKLKLTRNAAQLNW